jgi:hypothetical protein
MKNNITYEQFLRNPTTKTQEELLNTPWEELNWLEQILQSWLKKCPEMTLEEAIDYLQILP